MGKFKELDIHIEGIVESVLNQCDMMLAPTDSGQLDRMQEHIVATSIKNALCMDTVLLAGLEAQHLASGCIEPSEVTSDDLRDCIDFRGIPDVNINKDDPYFNPVKHMPDPFDDAEIKEHLAEISARRRVQKFKESIISHLHGTGMYSLYECERLVGYLIADGMVVQDWACSRIEFVMVEDYKPTVYVNSTWVNNIKPSSILVACLASVLSINSEDIFQYLDENDLGTRG